MDGRRIDLSATQVVASMLAAVTGAVAASFLGIAGTVIGAAVMSVASTAVAAIYKHYLASSRERLRAAADAARMAPRVNGHLLSRQRVTGPGQDLSRATTRQELSRAAVRRDRVAGPDDETQILPAVSFEPHRWDDTDRANGLSGPADHADGATELMRRADSRGVADGPGRPDEPPGTGSRDEGDAGGNGDGGPAEARRRRPRLLVLAGVALGVFLLAMAGITAFEALAGKPLNTLVGSGHGSGTTVGSIVGGSGSQTAPPHTGPARPSQGTSPTPRAPTSPAPSPTPSQTPTPTPTPSPTPSGSPSPATSAVAPASPDEGQASPAARAGP
jgi:hypothetical protein